MELKEMLLADAVQGGGWNADAKVPGIEEKVLWQAAPGYASLSLLRIAKGAGVQEEHRHGSNQFLYCLSGEYRYRSSGLTLQPGSFYWNPVGNPHGPSEALADSLILQAYDGVHFEEAVDLIEPGFRIGTELMHTNRLVNIWDVTLQPGESIPWHQHRFPYVVVTVDGGRGEIEDRVTGSARTSGLPRGSIVFDPGGAHHTLRNIGDTVIRDRLIEFKIPTNKMLPERVVKAAGE